MQAIFCKPYKMEANTNFLCSVILLRKTNLCFLNQQLSMSSLSKSIRLTKVKFMAGFLNYIDLLTQLL